MATTIKWDETGSRRYETGVDHGVLYLPDLTGDYVTSFPWNGLVSVTETPSGAEATPQYADNIKYLNLVSAEQFGGTIEAFTYPDQFGACDGTVSPKAGLTLGQQDRKLFGLSYRTILGNDLVGNAYGYKLHLAYGLLAAPSEHAFTTVNDSPEAVTLSWTFTSSAVAVEGHKPTSLLTLDSTKVAPADMAAIEALLYGNGTLAGQLPTPDDVIALLTTV